MAFTHLPLRRCLLAGVGAAVVGYATTAAAVVAAGLSVETITVAAGGERVAVGSLVAGPGESVAVGWLFYNAQLVPTTLPIVDPEIGRTLVGRNLLFAAGGPALAVTVLVPAALLAAGAAVAATSDGGGSAGAAIAVGYLPALVVGAFLLTAPAPDWNAAAGPSGIRTLVAGLVFPIVFGGVGGRLAD